MKTLFLILPIFLIFDFVSADEECKEISCFTKKDVANSPSKFDDALYDAIQSAKGCTNKKAVKKLLMSSHKVMGYVGMEGDMSKFVEKEFIANPECILSGFNELSIKNKNTISHFLMVSTYVQGKKIDAVLGKMKQKYPNEVSYIYKTNEQ